MNACPSERNYQKLSRNYSKNIFFSPFFAFFRDERQGHLRVPDYGATTKITIFIEKKVFLCVYAKKCCNFAGAVLLEALRTRVDGRTAGCDITENRRLPQALVLDYLKLRNFLIPSRTGQRWMSHYVLCTVQQDQFVWFSVVLVISYRRGPSAMLVRTE